MINDLPSYISTVMDLVKNGNMFHPIKCLRESIQTLKLDYNDLELYEDFLSQLFEFGMQKLDDLKEQKEKNPEPRRYIFPDVEADFGLAIDGFKTVKLQCYDFLEKEHKAHKMVLNVFVALIKHKLDSGDKAVLRREVFKEFNTLLTNGDHKGTIFFLKSVQLFIEFCENEELEDHIPPLINQILTSYWYLRGFGSDTYRQYANPLVRSCDIHLGGHWKSMAENDWKVAVRIGDHYRCLTAILAYIEMHNNFMPISLEMWRALRLAMFNFFGNPNNQTNNGGQNRDQSKEKERRQSFYRDFLFLFNRKDMDMVPEYDKWYCDLLRAEISLLTSETSGTERIQDYEFFFGRVAENAMKFADEPERVIDFLDAIRSRFECFCTVEGQFSWSVKQGLDATLEKIIRNPEVSEEVQKAMNDIDELGKCKECT